MGNLWCTSLDREVVGFYNLTITAFDAGNPPKSGSTSILIHVLDVNDNDPVFVQDIYGTSVYENVSVGFVVMTMLAVDIDEGVNGNVTYTLSNDAAGLFDIDAATGLLTVVGSVIFQ